MWTQKTHRLLKSQQVRMIIIYVYCLNTTCPSNYRHGDFMATGELGNFHGMTVHSQIHTYVYRYMHIYIYIFIWTMCPPGYYQSANSFNVTYALVYMSWYQ